ncbi:MAG TPA: hypothetical protein VL049_30080, partial [Candidatus Dormibacteraeota bacterium]|nr:hypothetical protein [Candidatus Dormibacteraeota bacterium]
FNNMDSCANNCGVPTPTPTPDPRAERCRAAKLKIAGKYEYCRLKEAAKAAKSGNAPDYAHCDDRFNDSWAAAEANGGGACPSNDDATAVQAHIAQHTDGLDAAIAGGSLPPCP